MQEDLEVVDLCSPRAGAPPTKKRRLGAAVQYVDLTEAEVNSGSRQPERGNAPAAEAGTNLGAARASQSAAVAGGAVLVGARPAAAEWAAAATRTRRSMLESPLSHQRQPRQPMRGAQAFDQRQQQRRHEPENMADDWLFAKQLQEEEDREAAAAAEAAEARLQRRLGELEAAEAAAEAAEAAGDRGWGRRGFLGSLLGGAPRRSSGASPAAAAAVAAAAEGPVGVAYGRGPRSQRTRRGSPADAEFAAAMLGHIMPPPYHAGRGGGRGAGGGGAYLGEMQALQQMMMGLSQGLPADLLLSGRDFTDADYEQLLQLDRGNKKKVAPRDRVGQLEVVRVPQGGRSTSAAAAAAAAAGQGVDDSSRSRNSGGSSSPRLELETCPICLEDARPGDRFKVLPCRHSFHCRCIDRWLLQERNACPICLREAV